MGINEQIVELIKLKGSLSASQIISESGKPRSSVFKALTELFKSGQLIKGGSHPNITYSINLTKDTSIPALETPSKTVLDSKVMQSKEDQIFNESIADPNKAAPEPLDDQPIGLGDLIFNRVNQVFHGRLHKFNSIKKVLITLIIVMLMMLLYSINRYVVMTSQVTQLRHDMGEQLQELRQLQMKLDETNIELNRRDAELSKIVQDKDNLSLQFNDQKEALEVTKKQVNHLQEQLKLVMEQLENEKKQAALILKDNAQLKEQIKTIQEIVKQQNSLLEAHALQLNAMKNGISLTDALPAKADQAVAQSGQSTDTVKSIGIDQIVLWTKQGMSSAEIVKRIKESKGIYSLLPETVQFLRQSNVSEEVIKVLLG